jgi:hypothetical protein
MTQQDGGPAACMDIIITFDLRYSHRAKAINGRPFSDFVGHDQVDDWKTISQLEHNQRIFQIGIAIENSSPHCSRMTKTK